MAQDTWLFGLLGSSPALALPDADHLSLTAGTTVITLLDRRIAKPDLPLVGRAWKLETMVSGGAASSVPAGVSASITFAADGSVSFDSGCNGGGGPYTVTSGSGTSVGSIAFGNLVMTAMACQEPRASVEAAFIAVVKGQATVAYKIVGSSLRLTGGGQELDFSA
jgi:heat shock protein HslJ